jgi:hypothetical protein
MLTFYTSAHSSEELKLKWLHVPAAIDHMTWIDYNSVSQLWECKMMKHFAWLALSTQHQAETSL